MSQDACLAWKESQIRARLGFISSSPNDPDHSNLIALPLLLPGQGAHRRASQEGAQEASAILKRWPVWRVI